MLITIWHGIFYLPTSYLTTNLSHLFRTLSNEMKSDTMYTCWLKKQNTENWCRFVPTGWLFGHFYTYDHLNSKLKGRMAKHKSVLSPAFYKQRKYLQSITLTFPWKILPKICKNVIMERYMRFFLKNISPHKSVCALQSRKYGKLFSLQNHKS